MEIFAKCVHTHTSNSPVPGNYFGVDTFFEPPSDSETSKLSKHARSVAKKSIENSNKGYETSA